jgi:hypothetical protein
MGLEAASTSATAAEQILEYLELCGWRLEHKPGARVSPAR